MKLLIIKILFLSLSTSVCAQKFTSLMDGLDFIQQNDIQYWVKTSLHDDHLHAHLDYGKVSF